MAFYEALAERIRRGLARKKGLEEKKLFGCIAFLLHGNVFAGVWKDSLIARLGPEGGDEALLEPHVKEFDITGRAMKGWVVVALSKSNCLSPVGAAVEGQPDITSAACTPMAWPCGVPLAVPLPRGPHPSVVQPLGEAH